ncbi:hypothetical protein BKA62DRAFT_775203 [Auriculariales sp. MPI-PUGE-AT-0066]|nr:hypothetical protein BKA62DRAFT_775203 [Auriculariales sp. MPI-PUGE-AT-0066]
MSRFLSTRLSSSSLRSRSSATQLSLSPHSTVPDSPSSSRLNVPRTPTTTSPIDHAALADSLHSRQDTDDTVDSELETLDTPVEHPFANATTLLTVVRENEEHVDLEAERAFYDQFPGLNPDDDDHASIRAASIELARTRHRMSIDGRSLVSDIILGVGDSVTEELTFARDVKISGWVTMGGTYVVYDCVITIKEGLCIHALKRYSAFEKLASTLRKTLPKYQHTQIPRLPPKNPLAKHRPAFLERRRRMLQAWLLAVLLHPTLGATEAARAWVLDS